MVSPIGSIGAPLLQPTSGTPALEPTGGRPSVGSSGGGAGGADGVPGAGGFGAAIDRALSGVVDAQAQADALAGQAATGQSVEVHDVMVAATQAQLATELTVAVRNRALESFNEIMRMPL